MSPMDKVSNNQEMDIIMKFGVNVTLLPNTRSIWKIFLNNIDMVMSKMY